MSNALALIDHWRQAATRGESVSWGSDRAETIIDHIDTLGEELAATAAHVEQLREVIAWNREAVAKKAAELAEHRQQRDATLVAEIQRLTALVPADNTKPARPCDGCEQPARPGRRIRWSNGDLVALCEKCIYSGRINGDLR